MSDGLAFTLPPDAVDAIVERAAELVREQLAGRPGEWLTVDEAAAYARCSRQRIYDLRSAGRLPKTGDGSRVLVRRSDLDAYLGGE